MAKIEIQNNIKVTIELNLVEAKFLLNYLENSPYKDKENLDCFTIRRNIFEHLKIIREYDK